MGVPDPDGVEEGVLVGSGVADGDGDPVPEPEDEPEADPEEEPEVDADPVGVEVPNGVVVTAPVPVRACVGVVVRDRVPLVLVGAGGAASAVASNSAATIQARLLPGAILARVLHKEHITR